MTAEITDVRGGLLAVQTDELTRLGGELGGVCWRLTSWTTTDAISLIDPELLASSALSPATYVDAERAVLAATGHLAVAAGEWGALAAIVEAVGQWFGGGEDEVRRMMEVQFGGLIGLGLVACPELCAAGAVGVAAGGAVWWATSTSQERAAAAHEAEAFLTSHPGLVRDLSGVLDGAVGGLAGWRTPPAGIAAGLAAQLYLDEGSAHVDRTSRTLAASLTQPRTVTDIVAHLRDLNDAPDSTGLIEIQSWHGPDGQLRHVVYLPGTDDLNPLSSDSDIRDVQEDLRIASGQRSAYMEGVERAMHEAGIGATESVLIAGHSLGGMVAVKELSEGSSFRITNVITAGSPTAIQRSLPSDGHVLSLQASGDIVPHVEGRPNRISPQQTTVTFASGETTIVGNHQPSTYVRGAAAVDASHDPAVRAAVEAIGPFFAPGGEVSSAVFRINRNGP